MQHLGELLHAVLPRLEGGDVVGRVGLPAVRRREGALQAVEGAAAVPVVVDAVRSCEMLESRGRYKLDHFEGGIFGGIKSEKIIVPRLVR